MYSTALVGMRLKNQLLKAENDYLMQLLLNDESSDVFNADDPNIATNSVVKVEVFDEWEFVTNIIKE